MRGKAVSLLIILLMSPALGSLFHSGNSVSIDEVNDNAYLAGNLLLINGPIKGDLVIGGNSITINGLVEGDVLAAGNTILINGNVTGDVRAFGSTITVNGFVGGELLSMSMQTMIMPGAELGELNAFSQEVIISGTINNNATIFADKISLSETSHITGILNYTSDNLAIISEGSVIEGYVEHNLPSEGMNYNLMNRISNWFLATLLMSLLSKLLTGFVLVKISKKNIKEWRDRMSKKPLMNILKGFALLILIPVASIIGLITVIGIPLSLSVFVLFLVMIYLASVIASVFIGHKVITWLKFKKQSILFELLIGVVIVELLNLLPVAGWIINLLVWLLSIGALIGLIRDKYANCQKKKIC